MSKRIPRAAALAAALLPAAWAVAAPLSLDQALDLAVQRSLMAGAARAATASAAERARAAGQLPDPMLSVGIDNLPVTGADAFRTNAEDMTMKRIGISQAWVASDKRAAREAVADAMTAREAVQARVAAADARLQTAMAYLDAYYAQEAGRLAALDEAQAREALEVGKARLATIPGNSAEVLGLSGASGVAEDASADLRQQQAAAQAILQRWTGTAPEALTSPHVAPVPTQEDYVARHPLVVARQRDLDVAREEARVARLDRRPDWTWELSYGQRQGRPDMVSFGVSIPLPVAPSARQDRETAARLALVDKAEAELGEARRTAAGEFVAGSGDVRRLQERIDRFRDHVVEPLRQRSATTLAAFRANQSSLSMMFEARHAELEAQRRLLELQRDLARAQARLAYQPVQEGAER